MFLPSRQVQVRDLQGWEGRTQGWESHQGAQIPEAVLKESRAEERPAHTVWARSMVCCLAWPRGLSSYRSVLSLLTPSHIQQSLLPQRAAVRKVRCWHGLSLGNGNPPTRDGEPEQPSALRHQRVFRSASVTGELSPCCQEAHLDSLSTVSQPNLLVCLAYSF